MDIDNLLISQPDCGEDALNIADMLVRSEAIDVLVVDSVAALVPKAEIEGQMGESHVGLQARLMSQALRKLTGVVARTGTCIIFTNQIREKIGVMFGNPETTTGGNALKFYASIRMDIRKTTGIKDPAGNIIGNRARVKVIKNKMAPPFRKGRKLVKKEDIGRKPKIRKILFDLLRMQLKDEEKGRRLMSSGRYTRKLPEHHTPARSQAGSYRYFRNLATEAAGTGE